MSLRVLPIDPICEIISQLDLHEKKVCRQINRSLRDIIDQHLLIQKLKIPSQKSLPSLCASSTLKISEITFNKKDQPSQPNTVDRLCSICPGLTSLGVGIDWAPTRCFWPSTLTNLRLGLHTGVNSFPISSEAFKNLTSLEFVSRTPQAIPNLAEAQCLTSLSLYYDGDQEAIVSVLPHPEQIRRLSLTGSSTKISLERFSNVESMALNSCNFACPVLLHLKDLDFRSIIPRKCMSSFTYGPSVTSVTLLVDDASIINTLPSTVTYLNLDCYGLRQNVQLPDTLQPRILRLGAHVSMQSLSSCSSICELQLSTWSPSGFNFPPNCSKIVYTTEMLRNQDFPLPSQLKTIETWKPFPFLRLIQIPAGISVIWETPMWPKELLIRQEIGDKRNSSALIVRHPQLQCNLILTRPQWVMALRTNTTYSAEPNHVLLEPAEHYLASYY